MNILNAISELIINIEKLNLLFSFNAVIAIRIEQEKIILIRIIKNEISLLLSLFNASLKKLIAINTRIGKLRKIPRKLKYKLGLLLPEFLLSLLIKLLQYLAINRERGIINGRIYVINLVWAKLKKIKTTANQINANLFREFVWSVI